MTAQISDVIYLDGKKRSLMSEPLEQYFETIGHRPQFQAPHTGLWRGYIATWRIKFDQLFLSEIEGFFPSPRPMLMKEIFPDADIPVKATWFSGKLVIPQGKLLQYEHIGFESIYQKETTIEVVQGDVVEINTVINKELGNSILISDKFHLEVY